MVFHRPRARIFFATVTLTALSACSSRQLVVESTPDGAEVRTSSGEVLGKTPLSFESAQLSKVTEDGVVSFRLSASGYVPLSVFTELRGIDTVRVNLTKLDDKYFHEEVAVAYSAQHNELARELLRIQNLVQARKIDEAAARLTTFQEKYPFVATGYLMQANLDLLRKDTDAARLALARARKLDPEDPVIARMSGGGTTTEDPKKPLVIEPQKAVEPKKPEEPKKP